MNSQPEEILREIFKRCLDIRYPHIQPFLPTEAPMLLCRVCVLWRTIAITTSELWTQLSVLIGREASEESQPSPQLIKMWTKRSGCQPLTLVLKDLKLHTSGADTANRILQLFLPHIHRWKSITLFLPNHPFPTVLMGLDTGPCQLQIAKLEFCSDSGLHTADTPQVAGLARLLTSSSQLHTLYWRSEPRVLQFVDIPWAQLTVVDLVPMWSPMFQILHLMENAPKLRSFSAFITAGCPVVRSLLLPDLVVLWIGSEVDVGPLFRRLTVPSLQNINVLCANLDPPLPPQTDIVNCIIRSGSLLNTAIFQSLHISNSDLIEFLRRSPSLLLFQTSDEGIITDEILGLLTARDTPYLCPNLRIIRFLEASVSSTDGLLADMIASRRIHSTAPLSCLVVHFPEVDLRNHTADVQRLKILGQAAGFRVWINEPETD